MRELKAQWKEWSIPILIFWLTTLLDVAVTYLKGIPALEANPLIGLMMNQGFSFLGSMVITGLLFTIPYTLLIIMLWATRFDTFALTLAIGLSVGHLIGAMTWFRNVLFLVYAPFIGCLLVGLFLDLVGVNLKIVRKGDEED